tara:strand:- start:2289 stop:2522 length:234 start_codon:yes stop_codon:yes gene_type:complete
MHKYHESRKRARKRWRQSDKGKLWDKAYARRDYVKVKAHEYYIDKKIREAKNDCLHAENTERFINYDRERRQEKTQQ